MAKKRQNKGWANLRPIKKGEVRNPKGRPKGESLTTKIRRILDEPEGNGTKADKMMELAVQYARKGDFRFFKEIIDRMDGKVPDRIANADGGAIFFTIKPGEGTIDPEH